MSQLIRPATIKVVPRDGEIEITLNINLTVEGNVVSAFSATQEREEDKFDKIQHIIPDFSTSPKLKFGK